MSQYIKGFHVVDRAWYAEHLEPGAPPEIMIGLYHPDGGCSGEFAIRWHDLGPYSTTAVPRLEIFDDAWEVFFGMPEMAQLAAHKKPLTQDEAIRFLTDHGFHDLTKYTPPEDAA